MDTEGRYENLVKAKDCENAKTVVETMETDRYMRTITSVYWDVDDFPYPEGSFIFTIVENIKSALKKKKGNYYYEKDIKIMTYVDRKNVTERMLHDFMHDAPEILGMKDPGHKRARLDNMILDIVFWAMRHPPIPGKSITNLMVISKNMPEDTMLVSILQSLKVRGYNIQLVEHINCAESEKLPHDLASQVWLWDSLIEGGSPIYGAQDYGGTDSEDPSGSEEPTYHGDWC